VPAKAQPVFGLQVPGEIVEVVFKAAACDGCGQSVKNEIETLIELAGIGQRAGIGFVFMGL